MLVANYENGKSNKTILPIIVWKDFYKPEVRAETLENLQTRINNYTGTEIPLLELRRRLLPLKERREAIVGMLNQKAGRNDPCPCQSGLKYKKCCGRNW